jgi:hypothetical protein
MLVLFRIDRKENEDDFYFHEQFTKLESDFSQQLKE